MKYLEKFEEATMFKLVDEGWTPEVARVICARVFRGSPAPEVEDLKAVAKAVIDMLWPVIANPSVSVLGTHILEAIEGQLDKEVYRGRHAEAASQGAGDAG